MTIHHSIVKMAAAKGVVMTLNDDAVRCQHEASATDIAIDPGQWPGDLESDNDTAREALSTCMNMVDWKADHKPGWSIHQNVHGQFLAALEGTLVLGEETFEDLVEAINDYEPEEGEGSDEASEDEDVVSTVVPAKFKLLYAEIGIDGQDNGDWLASLMIKFCRVMEGKKARIDVQKVEALAWANGIERHAVEGNRGWQGRYRMTVANVLRKRVADQGYLTIPAVLAKDATIQQIPAPATFCDRWATKPSKKAKAEAAKAAAEVAAKPARKPRAAKKAE